jgi:hypothetical protein
MPLKNPNVGGKSSQFSTDYPTSSIYADPVAGLSSLGQHIGSLWPGGFKLSHYPASRDHLILKKTHRQKSRFSVW